MVLAVGLQLAVLLCGACCRPTRFAVLAVSLQLFSVCCRPTGLLKAYSFNIALVTLAVGLQRQCCCAVLALGL